MLHPTSNKPPRSWLFIALGFACLGLVLRWPGLGAGWVLDDYVHIAMARGEDWPSREPWQLYLFTSGADEVSALRQSGWLPWWTDPEFRGALFRPLSSVLLWLTHGPLALGPGSAHALGALYWVLLVVAVSHLYSRTLPAPVAVVALLLYVLSRAHGVPLAWVANHCAVLAALFATLAISAHLRWRDSGQVRWLGVSLGLLALSWFSGEYGLAALGFLVAYEWLGRSDAKRARLVALLPAFGLAIAYLGLRYALGYGASGTTLYLDPVSEPLAFAARALLGVPMQLGYGLLVAAWPSLTVPLWLLAIIALLFWVTARQPERWLFVGGIIALLPTAGTLPDPRLLLLPAVGLLPALGRLTVRASAHLRTLRRVPSVALVLATLGLLGLHAVVAPWLSFRDTLRIARANRSFEQAALTAPLPKGTHTAVLIAAAEPFSLHYPALLRRQSGMEERVAWRVLSGAPRAHRLTRVSDASLELLVEGPGMIEGLIPMTYRRPDRALAVGDTVTVGDLRIDVLETGLAGPTRIGVKSERSLEEDGVVFLTFDGQAYRRVTLPAPGSARTIAAPGAPASLFQ